MNIAKTSRKPLLTIAPQRIGDDIGLPLPKIPSISPTIGYAHYRRLAPPTA